MSCASKHPCYLCESKREDGEWDDNIELRTMESIEKNKDNWILHGGKKIYAKKYLNCVDSPLIFDSDDNKKTPLLLKSPPPSLHLKLSLNTVLNVLYSYWPELDLFLKSLNITYSPYHGDTLGFYE